MFKYNNTIVTKCTFNLPEDVSKVTGICKVNAAIGVPENIQKIKNVRCKVNFTAMQNESDVPFIKLTTISEFAICGNIPEENKLKELAEKECIPISLKCTSKLIEDTTKTFWGKGLDIPLADE